MHLFYEGTDITGDVTLRKCLCSEAGGGRFDSLDILLDDAERWMRWGPQTNDKIVVVDGSYTTNTMYLNRIIPKDGKYRIIATSARCGVAACEWRSYEGKTLKGLIDLCAAQFGMEARCFGVDENAIHPYLIQQDETMPAFLQKLLAREGAVLKCVNGALCAIGIEYAQKLPVAETLQIGAGQNGIVYQKTSSLKWASLNVQTLKARGRAYDDAATTEVNMTLCGLPVQDNITAGRWAKGILLSQNRRAEVLRIQCGFDPEITALVRINVQSDGEANGAWLVDEVQHDFMQARTTASMLRCIDTIR